MQFQYSVSRCEITGGALHILGISYLAPRMALWHLKTRPPTITSTSASSPVCSSSNMPCEWERGDYFKMFPHKRGLQRYLSLTNSDTTTPNSEIQFLAAGFFLVIFRVVLIVSSSLYPYCSIIQGSSNEKASHLLGIFAIFAFFCTIWWLENQPSHRENSF